MSVRGMNISGMGDPNTVPNGIAASFVNAVPTEEQYKGSQYKQTFIQKHPNYYAITV